jgi:dipeptidyl aminopeptidase/acylaminoacyl peptidase
MRVQGDTAVSKEQCAPVLILHGSADKDVPSDQGKLFYAALQRLGVESSLVLYQGAGHSISARDQLIDAASRVVVHFGDHLQLDPAIVARVSTVGVGTTECLHQP